MAFTKITEADLLNKGVTGLPDTPGLTTTAMQEKFDELSIDVIVPKHNGLIDEMALSSAAANIGALDANGNDSTVQAELNYIKQGGYTKAETDVLLSNKVDREIGKGLSTYDFTEAYKDKLNNIEDNANYYVLPKGTQAEIGGVMGDGSTFTIDSNGVGHAIGGGGGGTADYSALINKPSINHVELIGDKDGSAFGFLSPIITITSDAGSTVKIKKGTEEITATQKTTTTWEAIPTSYGTWQVISSLAGADDATGSVVVDAVKTYATTVSHISATITVTYPAGATYCKCSKGSTEYIATSNPQTFTVRSTGVWTIETELDGIKKTATATISADGDSQSVTVEYASIEVTYDNNFRGQTITCSNGTLIYNKTAPSDANKVTFTIPTLDTWTVSAYASGDTYTRSVSVVAYTTYQTSLAVFNATITVTFPASNGATCTCNGITASTSPYVFNIGEVGTYSVVCTLDGASKSESVVITTDGQSETCTFEYGTINLTFDNEFRGQTITCVNGGTTISKTAPMTGNTMVLYPNATGNWTVSGVYSGTTYVSSPNPVVVSSLSTPVSATLQTSVSITVTLHGTMNDTITFTDASGVAKTEVFESGQTTKSVSMVVIPSGSNITFSSAVAKDTTDTSQDYTKTVNVNSTTTDVYAMPEHYVYWYGNQIATPTFNNGGQSTTKNIETYSITFGFNSAVDGAASYFEFANDFSGTDVSKVGVVATWQKTAGANGGIARCQTIKNGTGVNINSIYSAQTAQATNKTYVEGVLTSDDFNNSRVVIDASAIGDKSIITLYALWYE